VLAGSRLRGEHPAAMDLLEVPEWEFVSALGVPVVFVIYTEIPATVFRKAVVLQVLVLLRRRWPVTTPVITFVEDKASLFDQPPRMGIGSRIQSHRHQAPPAWPSIALVREHSVRPSPTAASREPVVLVRGPRRVHGDMWPTGPVLQMTRWRDHGRSAAA
jgi:hypothetical protein